jgi:hypothetical protein
MRIPAAALALVGAVGACTPAPTPESPPAAEAQAESPADEGSPEDGAPTTSTGSEDEASAVCRQRKGPGRPVIVSHEAFQRRLGAKDQFVVEVASDPGAPVQTCGEQGTAEWIANLHCDDETRPAVTAGQAMDALVGSVGPGGLCGHDILHYRLKCSDEKASAGVHDVYVDMYWCEDDAAFDLDPLVDH